MCEIHSISIYHNMDHKGLIFFVIKYYYFFNNYNNSWSLHVLFNAHVKSTWGPKKGLIFSLTHMHQRTVRIK